MKTKEDIILDVLNEEPSSYIHLMDNDRRRLAHTIAKILDAINESELELKRKNASDKILAKLDLLTELGSLHDELKKIPWYKFSDRNALKWKIRELDSKRLYGRHFKTNVRSQLNPVEVAPAK